MKNKEINVIETISNIENKYSTFLIDLWGVVHNGIEIFPNILDVLEKLKKNEKKIIFITNAPRRAMVIEKQLTEFGINRNLYSKVISSGEITWRYLFDNYKEKKISLLHIGPPRDDHLINGLSYEKVDEPQKAEILINTGPWGDYDKLENYKDLLNESLKCKLPMICSNPDKTVIRGEKFMICAGKLAEYYEENGGSVKYFGKPYPEIYNFIFTGMKNLNKKEILIIGDSLENDIKGANLQKCDSLLISNGIHREKNNKLGKISKNLYNLIALKKIYPNFISYNLSW